MWSSLRADQSTEQRPVSAVAGGSRTIESPEASTIIGTYCAGCHNGVMRSPSGALLDQFDTARIADNPDTWTRAYRQLQAGTMPPVGAPRPDRPAYDAVLTSIETALGADAAPPADATSQEIADRLALLLWNSAPDASLLHDAQRNRLTNPATLERQIKRMLDDERAACLRVALLLPLAGTRSTRQSRPGQGVLPRLRRVAARRDGDGKPNCSCSVNCGRTAIRSSSGMRTTRS